MYPTHFYFYFVSYRRPYFVSFLLAWFPLAQFMNYFQNHTIYMSFKKFPGGWLRFWININCFSELILAIIFLALFFTDSKKSVRWGTPYFNLWQYIFGSIDTLIRLLNSTKKIVTNLTQLNFDLFIIACVNIRVTSFELSWVVNIQGLRCMKMAIKIFPGFLVIKYIKKYSYQSMSILKVVLLFSYSSMKKIKPRRKIWIFNFYQFQF